MKKRLFQFLIAFLTGNNGQIKALKILLACTLSCISYISFGQVVVTPANDTVICSRTAVGGTAPTCTTIGTITLTETANSDFASGSDQIILTPPAGWQFCTATPTYSFGGDISAVTGTPTSGSLILSITATGVANRDVITITGLQVQPLSTGSSAGNIYASSTTGVTGITIGAAGTSFGRLREIPAPITAAAGPLPSFLCTNSCVNLSDAIPGGVWTSSNPAIATVGSSSGLVCGVAAGTVNISYSISGCTTIDTFTVNAGPKPIVGAHNMCAWYDSIVFVRDSTPGGLYSSTGVTTVQVSSGLPAALGKVYANAPGVDTIFYTVSSGCRTFVVLTVNPLPVPFSFPPYEMCAGSQLVLFDSVVGGTFSSSLISVVRDSAIGDSGVILYGVNPGISILTYTLPTGCKIDTPIKVDSIPGAIVGPSQVCSLSTITLTDPTRGGTWSSSNSRIATVDPSTGVVTGDSVGSVLITYTIAHGCNAITFVTVDPLPDSITGPTFVCVGATITLSDATGGGIWRSTNGNATVDSVTGIVTGVTAGTDTIQYFINPGNCWQQYIITINPLPAPIVGPSHVCQGSTIGYTDPTTPGTWGSSSGSVGTIDATSGTFTAISPGTTAICYTLSFTTGCSICDTVTVDPTPPAITGPTQVCVGDSILLLDGMTPGVWSVLDHTVASIDTTTGELTGLAPGIETVIYTVGNCSVSYIVTVNANPTTIIGPYVLCQGDTATYTDVPAGGTWTVTPSSIATIDPATGLLTAVSAGTVLLNYTVAGCSIDTSININPKAPIQGPDSVCQGSGIVLIDTVLGGTWTQYAPITTFVSIGTIPVASDSLVGTGPGVDTIYYTINYGANSCISKLVLTVNPIGPIIATTTQECVGDTTTLVDLTPPTGVWSDAPGTFGFINPATGQIAGVAAGVETVTYSAPHGCFATIQFTINPLPAPITGPTTVCQMDSIQLIETSTGGTWRASNGNVIIDSLTGVVTGVHVGVDTITYAFDTTHCKVFYVVSVNALAPILGRDSLCLNDSVILTNVDTNGVWSNANPAVGSITGQHIDTAGGGVNIINYHGLLPGVDSVFYTMNTTGCRYAFFIRVNGLPDAITGRDTLCVGDTTTLRDDSLGGHWTVSNAFASIGFSTGTVTGLSGRGVDTVTYTLPTGCKTTTTVTVYPNPVPILGPPFNVCLGHDTLLTDATPGGIWSVTNSLITPITTGGSIHGSSLGVDTVIYTLPAGGCKTQLAVTVTPIPVVTTNHPGIKCKYASVQLIADSGQFLPRSYSWTPTTGLSNPLIKNPVASPTITTTYTVVATDNNTGCDSFATVTVIVDSELNNMRIIGADSICAGACDLLMASGRAGTYFNWHPAVGLSCTICDTVTACPDSTTTYWAVAVDSLGCKDSLSFTVTVNPIPVIGVRPNPTILCKRTPLQVHMYTTNTDSTTMTWAWTPNLFLSCDSCSNPILTDTANIIYNVIGTTQYGCYDSFKVKVSVLDTNVNTVSLDTNICLGGTAKLIATSHSLYSNLDVPTFMWIPSTALSAPDSNVTFANPTSTTTYSVAIHENVCFSDTLAVTVIVQPYPVINLTPPSPNHEVAGTPTQLVALVTNTPIEHYIWHPASTLTCDTCFNPIATPTVNTTYVVTVTSIYGCTTTDSVTILINCDQSQIFIPNTFTPNGDGVNDRFYVSAKGVSVINNLSVYNRWGQLVYQAINIPPNDAGAGWDGTFKGLVLEPDVFVYTVEATCELGGPPLKYKGDVSIVK